MQLTYDRHCSWWFTWRWRGIWTEIWKLKKQINWLLCCISKLQIHDIDFKCRCAWHRKLMQNFTSMCNIVHPVKSTDFWSFYVRKTSSSCCGFIIGIYALLFKFAMVQGKLTQAHNNGRWLFTLIRRFKIRENYLSHCVSDF